MRVNDFCPPPHLTADDFPEDTEVTIKEFATEKVGETEEDKGVIYFDEFDRGLVINRTNALTIQEIHGGELEQWIGKKVTLYQSTTKYMGVKRKCIRVREK